MVHTQPQRSVGLADQYGAVFPRTGLDHGRPVGFLCAPGIEGGGGMLGGRGDVGLGDRRLDYQHGPRLRRLVRSNRVGCGRFRLRFSDRVRIHRFSRFALVSLPPPAPFGTDPLAGLDRRHSGLFTPHIVLDLRPIHVALVLADPGRRYLGLGGAQPDLHSPPTGPLWLGKDDARGCAGFTQGNGRCFRRRGAAARGCSALWSSAPNRVGGCRYARDTPAGRGGAAQLLPRPVGFQSGAFALGSRAKHCGADGRYRAGVAGVR